MLQPRPKLESESPMNTKTAEPEFANRASKMTVSAIREILKVTERPDIISFAGGLPAPELFPVAEFSHAYQSVFETSGEAALQYSTTEGWMPLREWIADRMRSQQIDTSAQEILITSGSQQGIFLVAQAFLNPGDAVVVENPSYLAALQAFSSCEANFIPVDSDEEGMCVEALEQVLETNKPKLIYVVANFHNPKGTTLSLARREHLIRLATRYRIPLLEDDPYGELRYRGEALPHLAALDTDGWTIYLSTFSKTLSPGMRIGWAAASPSIIRKMTTIKQAIDLHTGTLQQRAAAQLLSSFDYDGHIGRLCHLYRQRCATMLEAIANHFPEEVWWTKPEGGMFIWVELPEAIDSELAFQDALNEKVAFVPGKSFFASQPRHNFIRLNFSNSKPEAIEQGIARIGNILKRRAGWKA